jgi:hypothetical protein
MAAAAVKGLAQGVANLGNAVQDLGVGLLNVPAASVNFGSWVSETLIFDVPEGMKIRVPYIPSPDWSKGLITPESDFDHKVSKVAAGIGVDCLLMAGVLRTATAARRAVEPRGLLDAIENGRLGGNLYSSTKLDSLGKYLNRRGIRLRLDGDEVLPPNVAAGFDGVKKEIIFRRNATEFEVWHELSHFRHYKTIGPEAYNSLTRVQKEQFVFDMLENSKKRWYGMSDLERRASIEYILRIGGIL